MLSPNLILQNRYRIVRKLGEGGMGAIYEAVDQRVSCVVVLKETLMGGNNEARQAFQREAALLANLRHSSLPKVMDYFSEGEGEFLVMEYIAGHDLAELLELRNGPFPLAQVLQWADDVLRLLEYLHTRQPPIVHRDIKPANLKVTSEGEIFLLDFGLAKGAVGQMITIQTDKSVFGYTPVYAPIEQIHASGTDPRSDIYSLGATLYDLLTGQPPVPASVRFEAIETDRADPLTAINELNRTVPGAVAAIIQRAMSLSRRERFPSAAEMREALSAANQRELDREAQTRRMEAELAKTLPAELPDDGRPLYVDQNVQFTVYAPRKIKPKKIYSLLAFAHLSRKRADAGEDEPDPIAEMRQQAARILGEQRANYDDAQQSSSQPVPQGGELTFAPFVNGLTFSPPTRTFDWRKSVHREEFDVWASADVDGQNLKGRMTVFLGALVIAEVPLQITVDSTALPASEQVSLEEPQTARRLRQIFASYSLKDEPVVTELAQVAPIFGSQFITDRTHLMPGEDRSEGTRRLIGSADAFQLFWSSNSMRSADVMNEIDYAVSLNKKNFILPTYWEDPLPRSPQENLPPEALERLHFFRIYPGSISQAMNETGAKSTSTQPASDRPTLRYPPAPAGQAAPIQNDVIETAPFKVPSPTTPSYDRGAPTLSEIAVPQVPVIQPQQTVAGFGANVSQNSSPAAMGKSKRKIMMPIMAGVAMVFFVAIVGPVLYFTNLGVANRAAAPLETSNSNQNRMANSNMNASANVAATPPPKAVAIIPSRINPPADFIAFAKTEPAYQEPGQTQEVDLDGDGIPELLAQYEFCGSGGCSIHLFQRSGNGFKDISGDILEYMFPSLNDDSRGSFSAGPSSTRGYLDLRYRFKKGGPTMNFKFDGRKYRGGP